MAMITVKKDLDAANYEKIEGKDLMVINSHFSCNCENTGWCFRHGVDKKNPTRDISRVK